MLFRSSPYSGVISRFIKLLLAGEPPTIHGDGEQTRDFTHVKNVVDANILAMTTVDENALNQTYNIAAKRRKSTICSTARLPDEDDRARWHMSNKRSSPLRLVSNPCCTHCT